MKKQKGFGLVGVLLIIGALIITAGGMVLWRGRVSPALISCQTSADCPPSLGVCGPDNCPTWRCLDGRCVYFKDAKDASALCQSAGGIYKTFPTTCADSCEFVRKVKKGLNVFCGEAMTDSCDCGPDKCWNGISCEPN